MSLPSCTSREIRVKQGSNERANEKFSLLRDYTEEDHRRRLENIKFCRESTRGCMRQHLITSYLPGQATYTLGEYPALTPWNPDEKDEQELDRLKEHGIELLQVFDDWNDSLRLFGGDKYEAVNPEGYKRFLDMAHRRGMKVLTYTSTCYLEPSHPEFKESWRRDGQSLVGFYWNMSRNSPGSPGWRAFLFPRLHRILDEYGMDGLYMDGGYITNRNYVNRKRPTSPDEVEAFRETPDYDGSFTDLVALVYSEIKRRGGIFKLHLDLDIQPQSGDLKIYDYLWVGEGVTDIEGQRDNTKNFPPYVVPTVDFREKIKNPERPDIIENLDEPFLNAIPYMQFPILYAGRKYTGERGQVPGVKYTDGGTMVHCQKAWEAWQKDSVNFHCYSPWDNVPGSPETRRTHERWLKKYLPMVEEGTWAWIDIDDSSLFVTPKPKDVVATLFANREAWLVLANYGRTVENIVTNESYIAQGEADAAPLTRFELAPRSLLILKKHQA